MRWNEIETQVCSIARTLSVIGDRWTMLILRNCFLGTKRFDAFQRQLGVTRHRLADRLNRLVEQGILTKVPYQERPLRHEYRLTQKGLDLYPVMLTMARWGDQWMDNGDGPPVEYLHRKCGHVFQATLVCSECGEPLTGKDVAPKMGPGLRAELERLPEEAVKRDPFLSMVVPRFQRNE